MTITPSITLRSFNCPHCKVLAQQFWWSAQTSRYDKDTNPTVWQPEAAEARIAELKAAKDFKPDEMASAFAWVRKTATGGVFFADEAKNTYTCEVENLFFSRCYNCDRIAVWIYDRLVHPAGYDAPAANSDMPGDVRADYDEAAAIAGLSSRGAAALLRLALQRLMPALGEKGKDLNEDIKALVEKGLDPRIQRSLDIVRVTGNHAVHPGQISFEDNAETVATLFKLVNVIVDVLISQPKHIEAAYSGLPAGARDAIEKRDKK